jgi:carbon starvation protein
MMILAVLVCSILFLGLAGRGYAHFLAKCLGENNNRQTPATLNADGRDYVPTPTPIVFAHHFASIAGAGPIVGPVIAIIFGWLPALLWILLGGVLIGAVHDYLATYMATREGGESVATIARRMLGKNVFVAFMLFLVIMLALVCASFLNLSATALTSMLPYDRIELPKDQTLFRIVNNKVVIGGIASMSVILITAVAPLVGWLYIKKKVAVWKCSFLAIGICIASVVFGLYHPVSFPDQMNFLGLTFTPQSMWVTLLSIYVLLAAGVPVWIFLQSRDFINVHILYIGMIALLASLAIAGLRGGEIIDPIPVLNIAQGEKALNGPFWPMLFIVIACGAVSGFHSLCAGGTTSKQLTSEAAARRIGYYGMLLESFLAVCVIAALMIGVEKSNYIADVHPELIGLKGSNAVLGFAMAVGGVVKRAFGAPIAVGALAGMILLEGFLVTTLDTAIRLMRYLLEEVWRTIFGNYDVFAKKATDPKKGEWGGVEKTPVGADGLPAVPDMIMAEDLDMYHGPTIVTKGIFHKLLCLLNHYWFNSGFAVAITLAFALTGGAKALWGIFATANQLLAAFVLLLGSLWLLRQGRKRLFALIPAVAMLVTTVASLILLLQKYLAEPSKYMTLLAADVVMLALTAYLLIFGLKEVFVLVRSAKANAVAASSSIVEPHSPDTER